MDVESSAAVLHSILEEALAVAAPPPAAIDRVEDVGKVDLLDRALGLRALPIRCVNRPALRAVLAAAGKTRALAARDEGRPNHPAARTFPTLTYFRHVDLPMKPPLGPDTIGRSRRLRGVRHHVQAEREHSLCTQVPNTTQ